ncbi:helix-turn-helix domain-containing protein [[Ruminococcus] torques]|uniref:helix-turn-helix domain-containing protein n=1 Tax=[Ruminococcus] torques TaxID=33039 RepID=UPI00242A8468|nr:helix-turn-helix transcriptional regulator [[Ruminococcus] torques]
MENTTFGRYLSQLREKKDVTLRELARQLGISAAFLSDVEKDRKPPLTAERLEKLSEVLHLTKEENDEMNILVGKQRGTLPPDLNEYSMHDYVSNALRTAKDLDAGEEEWLKFIEELKKKKG